MQIVRFAQKQGQELLLWEVDRKYLIVEITVKPYKRQIRGGFFSKIMAETRFDSMVSDESYNPPYVTSSLTPSVVGRMFRRAYG